MNEITRQIMRWFADHNIASGGFTLVLDFADEDSGVRFDCALRSEIEQSSFVRGANLDLAAFTMNGITVRVRSPMHA